jgi:hypothetical protein
VRHEVDKEKLSAFMDAVGNVNNFDLAQFPGGDLVEKGLLDLQRHSYSEEALLVLVARPRLMALGFDVPSPVDVVEPYEHALYSLIEERLPNSAHSPYNALNSAHCQLRELLRRLIRPHPCVGERLTVVTAGEQLSTLMRKIETRGMTTPL